MDRLPLRECARRCGISLDTSFKWRHRLLDGLQKIHNSVKLTGVVEADEVYFSISYKGSRKFSAQHAGIYTLATGMISAQYGNPYPKSRLEVNNPLNNVFRSKDQKWVVLCLPEYDRDWPRVMHLIGRDELAEHPDYSCCQTVNDKGLAPEVVKILDDGFAQFTREELLKMFSENDMPCEPAQTPTDIYEDQNALINEYIKPVQYPAGPRWCPTAPVQFELGETEDLIPGGKLGSATEDVMKELGYSEDEIKAAEAEGAVSGPVDLAVLQGK